MPKIKKIPFPPDYVERTLAEMVRDENAKAALREDRNCLSWWFPKIEAAGLPVPKTQLLSMPEAAQIDAWRMIDREPEQKLKAWLAFIEAAKNVAGKIGYPLFLRSGHTSGKHEWDRTCYVPSANKLNEHIFSIIYFSECCGMFGDLPWRTWAFRELLPMVPITQCPSYANMPVCKEFRFFAEDGNVLCWHPYWPRFSLERGGAKISDAQFKALSTPDNLRHLTEIAGNASRVCGGAWSVDLLQTERGWFLTDMAEARSSYHWEECPHLSSQ